MDRTPQTLLEAVTYFSDPGRAHAYAVQMRWPNGIACPRQGCGSASVQAIATRKTWRCKECKRQFSVKVGTIFEDSPIAFTKWLPAFWLLSNTKNGTSSCELARALGVTQKTAWFMLHRIRETMATRTFEKKMQGLVEVDEAFVGGTLKKLSKWRRAKRRGPRLGKTAVFGLLERGEGKGKSRVRAMIVPTNRSNALLPRIFDNVAQDATVYSDALMSYDQLPSWGYDHEVINHAVEEYVRGRVHTNSIENFWSCLKRTLGERISRRDPSTSTHTSTSKCSASMSARTTTAAAS
jgi:transposase-like protein